jgi:hypothetical protein
VPLAARAHHVPRYNADLAVTELTIELFGAPAAPRVEEKQFTPVLQRGVVERRHEYSSNAAPASRAADENFLYFGAVQPIRHGRQSQLP